MPEAKMGNRIAILHGSQIKFEDKMALVFDAISDGGGDVLDLFYSFEGGYHHVTAYYQAPVKNLAVISKAISTIRTP